MIAKPERYLSAENERVIIETYAMLDVSSAVSDDDRCTITGVLLDRALEGYNLRANSYAAVADVLDTAGIPSTDVCTMLDVLESYGATSMDRGGTKRSQRGRHLSGS